MVFSPHYRISVNGVFGESVITPYEEWSTRFTCAPFDTVDFEPDLNYVTWANSVMNELQSLFTGGDAVFTNGTHVRSVRVAAIDSSGHVMQAAGGGAFLQGDSTHSAVSGSSSSNYHPLQTALVVTLHTPRTGRHGRGRNYWPYLATPLLQDGRINTTPRNNALAGFVDFYNGLNSAAETILSGVQNRVRVMASDGGGGLVHSIGIGRVLDTQRRRRRSLDEDYATSALSV